MEEILSVLDQIAPSIEKKVKLNETHNNFIARSEASDIDNQSRFVGSGKTPLEHSNSSHSNSAESGVVQPTIDNSRRIACAFDNRKLLGNNGKPNPSGYDRQLSNPIPSKTIITQFNNNVSQTGYNDNQNQGFKHQSNPVSIRDETLKPESANPLYMEIVQSPPVAKKAPIQSYLHLESKFRSKHIPNLRIEKPPNYGANVNSNPPLPTTSQGNPNNFGQNLKMGANASYNQASSNLTAQQQNSDWLSNQPSSNWQTQQSNSDWPGANPSADWQGHQLNPDWPVQEVTQPTEEEKKEEVIREELYDFLPMPPSASTAQEQINSAFCIPSPSTNSFESEEMSAPRRSNSMQESSPHSYSSPNSKLTKTGTGDFRPRVPRRAPLTPPVSNQSTASSISNNQSGYNYSQPTQSSGSHGNSRTSLGSSGVQVQGQGQLQGHIHSPSGNFQGNPDTSNKGPSNLASPKDTKTRQSRLPMFSKQSNNLQRSVSANSESSKNENQKEPKESGLKSPFSRRRSNSRPKKNKNQVQNPPALPPNHPSPNQRRDFSPSENPKQPQNLQTGPLQIPVGGHSPMSQGSGNSPQGDMSFNRVLSHHDPWIREIARKYASPPQSPSLDNRNEAPPTFGAPQVSGEQHLQTDALVYPNVNSESDDNCVNEKQSKKPKGGSKMPKQSSIPVKRGGTPVNKRPQKQSSEESTTSSTSKNKKSLKLKIPSLLRKHTGGGGRFNSNPVVPDHQDPAKGGDVITPTGQNQHPVFLAAAAVAPHVSSTGRYFFTIRIYVKFS